MSDLRIDGSLVPRSIDEIVAPRHSALVVVDVLNDFVHDDGYSGRHKRDVRRRQAAVPRINELILAARKVGAQVAYIRQSVRRDSALPNMVSLFGGFEALAAREGTWGAEYFRGLVLPSPDDSVVTKRSYDGFQDTELDDVLRRRGVGTCIYVGFSTNVCVEATARHGFVAGYFSVLVSDATGTASPAEQAASEGVFRAFYGPVLTTRELLEAWGTAGA